MSDCHFGVSPVNYPDPDPESLISYEKLGDIQMVLQLSECLSETNICEQTCFPGTILFLCNTTVILIWLVFKLKDF